MGLKNINNMAKKGLDRLEELPYRTRMKNNTVNRYCHTSNRGIYRRINDKFPWTHVERVLRKYKGKNVNKAFSHYCSIVDKCQQYLFWDELNDPIAYKYRWDKDYRWGYYYIDNQSRIQYKKPIKGETSYTIHSHDLRWETVKVTLRNEDQVCWWKSDAYYQGEERQIVQGEIFVFKKKGDTYHKCYAEQIAKQRKAEREAKIESDKRVYSFLTKQEEEAIDDRKSDITKRDAHGFDEDSFTNNNGRLN